MVQMDRIRHINTCIHQNMMRKYMDRFKGPGWPQCLWMFVVCREDVLYYSFPESIQGLVKSSIYVC